MPALTPEQIAALMEIIRSASTAVAISTTGYAVVEAERKRLELAGYIRTAVPANIVLDSYSLGAAMAENPHAEDWTYQQLLAQALAGQIPLSPAENEAVLIAQQRAGTYCVGLGNRYSSALGQVVVDADAELAASTRTAIRDKVSEKLAKRTTVKQLKLELGRVTGDWARDWDRIAATESHAAHQEGMVGAIVKRHGDDELIAVIPEVDACKHCLRVYLEGGKPKIRPASWWYEQGSNVGRKAADWKPVIPPAHSWCRCVTTRVPAGWGFNDAGDLVPPDEEPIEKARKLHGRLKFQGMDISIENRKGSVRQWYDVGAKKAGTTTMKFPYGYIRMSEGADGDHVDCYVGPHESAKKVYIVHQMKAPLFLDYDEDKIFLGFESAAAAKAAYLYHYDNPRFFGSMTTMGVATFRRKVFERKGTMIKGQTDLFKSQLDLFGWHAAPKSKKGAQRRKKSGGGFEYRYTVPKRSAPDSERVLDLWKSAVTDCGFKPSDFRLIVKHARDGHGEARKALDRIQAEFAKAASGQGFPIHVGSEASIGTMGNWGDPARTASQNTRQDYKRAEPRDDWPPNRKSTKKRLRRQLPSHAERFDVTGLRQPAGWDHPYNYDGVVTTTVPLKAQDRTIARDSLVQQQASRKELREGSNLLNELEPKDD